MGLGIQSLEDVSPAPPAPYRTETPEKGVPFRGADVCAGLR